MENYEHLTAFLTRLNALTAETGVVIDTFGDPFYDPKLSSLLEAGAYAAEPILYFSYDLSQQSYVARIGNPYDGPQVFPITP